MAALYRFAATLTPMSDIKPPRFGTVAAYFHVEGGCKFLDVLQEGLGAEVTMDMRDPSGAVAHAEVLVAGLMCEVSEARPEFPATRSAFHVFVEDPDAAHAKAIAAGATELRAVEDNPYGERSGALQDPWGNNWYFARVTDMATRTGASS